MRPGIDFEIVQGYYFNSGRNNRVGETIEYIFEQRQKAKNEKDSKGNKKPNPIQAVYKLMMNAAYGKTIMKPVNEESKFIYSKYSRKTKGTKPAKQVLHEFLLRNEAFVTEWIEVIPDVCYEVKYAKSIQSHKSRPHVGGEILSMSKRIAENHSGSLEIDASSPNTRFVLRLPNVR